MFKHCIECGGHGFKDKPCPLCGREARNKTFKLEQSVIVESAKTLDIPNSYRGVCWHKDILINSHLEFKNDLTFIKFSNQLEKIHNMFADGKIINKSAIIIAPPQFSKVTFSYSCMQHALANGMSVAPLFDSQEVKRLITLAAEKPIKNYLMDYDEYINKDVCFITITKTSYREEAYQIIQEILDKRSRRNLPTFFISRYSLETMSKRDWNASFKYIKDYNNTENSIKYPAIISYWIPTNKDRRV